MADGGGSVQPRRATPGAVLAALSGDSNVIVIRRPLVQWLGDEASARMLDQLLYESDRHGGDWFPVTDAEWAERLLLSPRTIQRVRIDLEGNRLIETDRRGVPARMFYLVDRELVFEMFAVWLASRDVELLRQECVDSPANLPDKTGSDAGHSLVEDVDVEDDVEDVKDPVPAGTSATPSLNLPPTATITVDAQSWVRFIRVAAPLLGITSDNELVKKSESHRIQGWLGKLIGKAGYHAGDDQDYAIELMRRWSSSKAFGFLSSNPDNWSRQFNSWAMKSGQSRAKEAGHNPPAPAVHSWEAGSVWREGGNRGEFAVKFTVLNPKAGTPAMWEALAEFIGPGRPVLGVRESAVKDAIRSLAALGGVEIKIP